jgi:DNA-binding response OmpR family regulator
VVHDQPAAEAPRVLIVEDDASIRELLALHLGLEGFACVTLEDGREALRRTEQESFDLIVLDLMLPGVDGITLCRAIRRGGPNRDSLVLMLTARREEADKVLGLESGADDYLAKPFGIREFLARVAALLRRRRVPAEAGGADEVISVHGIEIVPARLKVVVRGHQVELTRQEFGLLQVLATSPGIVFSREALLSRVWRDDTFVTDRSVDALVKRLRRKIEQDPASPVLLLTVWGTGYKMADA